MLARAGTLRHAAATQPNLTAKIGVAGSSWWPGAASTWAWLNGGGKQRNLIVAIGGLSTNSAAFHIHQLQPSYSPNQAAHRLTPTAPAAPTPAVC
ncbi:MAG: hypothetical protein H6668_02015 [Ardenticatenaceae bacterium]|nr:hypothetical protein [Ardenticatenaceae bacterium]